jgi:iron complex outermembrane receptor protein
VKTAYAVISIFITCTALGQVDVSRIIKLDSNSFVVPVFLDSITVGVYKRSEGKELISSTLLKANPSQNFAELLQKQSGIFVRSSGAGMLSTPSYKGLGTQQTPILINGANMQSSMNGTMDLSLIDAAHFGKVSLNQANASTTGAQSMGDAISLSSLSKKDGLYIGLSASTQNELSANIKYVRNKERWRYSISGVASHSENKVSLEHYGIDKVQTNTDFKRASLLQTIGHEWLHSEWTNTLYLQGSERGVSPQINLTNNSRQLDVNAMMVNKYTIKTSKNWIYEATNQIWAEQIVFDNAQNGVQTDSRVFNSNTTASGSKYLKNKWLAKIGLAQSVARYTSEALAGDALWNRPRVFLKLRKTYDNIKFSLSQNTIFHEKKQAFSGELRSEGDFAEIYRWSASVNRVYRLPVLNELYWYMPGEAVGNPDLKPEQGYKIDTEVGRYGRSLQMTLNPHAGIFQNWVQWVGAGEVTPENIPNVMVYGAVFTANHEQKFKKIKVLTMANVHWVNASYQFDNKRDTRNNKQLIFTPQFTGNLTLTVVHSKFGLYINSQLVSTNYVASDNSSFIEPYQLYELGGYYEWENIRMGAVASNLLDTPYFTQPRTPLPGRIFKININYILPFKK